MVAECVARPLKKADISDYVPRSGGREDGLVE